MRIWFILIIILCAVMFILWKTCKEKFCSTNEGVTKGIFYFDVDGTIITSENFDSIVKECLKNNIAVGIATNSMRTVDFICTGNKAGGKERWSDGWMSSTLCKQFNKNGGRMFNSKVIVAGSRDKPPGYPENRSPGYIKTFNMKYGRDLFYPNVPNNCVVLFDDDPGYLEGVREYNRENGTDFGSVCANFGCGGKNLDIYLVKRKIKEINQKVLSKHG